MWSTYVIEKDKIYKWKLGNTAFWISKINEKWQIANKSCLDCPGEFVVAQEVGQPENIEWKSYVSDDNNNLTVVPVLPDRPIVVKPLNMFKLLPYRKIQIYVYVPVWIALYSGDVEKENFMCEFPTVELSSTWFGDPSNGLLSYSLPKALHSTLELGDVLRNEVICPIRITNTASGPLDFQRLSLHVESVAIYEAQEHLCTNEIQVKFKGENSLSDIAYGSHAPSFLQNAKQLSAPRNPARNNVLRRSFYFIKSFTD